MAAILSRERWVNSISNYHTSYLLTCCSLEHYNDIMLGVMASRITSLTIVYSSVYSGANQRRCPMNSPHKGPVTRKKFPFDDVIMVKATNECSLCITIWMDIPDHRAQLNKPCFFGILSNLVWKIHHRFPHYLTFHTCNAIVSHLPWWIYFCRHENIFAFFF